MVSVVFDFWPCACELFNNETPDDDPDCTLSVAYGCDDDGKKNAFGCKSDVDFDEEPAQFGSDRPRMIHC